MPKEMELEGKGGYLERIHVEKSRFVYQEEIIIFSSLQLFCSVGSIKNQGKDPSRGKFDLFCSIPPRFIVTAKIVVTVLSIGQL